MRIAVLIIGTQPAVIHNFIEVIFKFGFRHNAMLANGFPMISLTGYARLTGLNTDPER